MGEGLPGLAHGKDVDVKPEPFQLQDLVGDEGLRDPWKSLEDHPQHGGSGSGHDRQFLQASRRWSMVSIPCIRNWSDGAAKRLWIPEQVRDLFAEAIFGKLRPGNVVGQLVAVKDLGPDELLVPRGLPGDDQRDGALGENFAERVVPAHADDEVRGGQNFLHTAEKTAADHAQALGAVVDFSPQGPGHEGAGDQKALEADGRRIVFQHAEIVVHDRVPVPSAAGGDHHELFPLSYPNVLSGPVDGPGGRHLTGDVAGKADFPADGRGDGVLGHRVVKFLEAVHPDLAVEPV